MWKLFSVKSNTKHDQKSGFYKAAEKELGKNKKAIESLRDYDAGKKDISTTDVERRLRSI